MDISEEEEVGIGKDEAGKSDGEGAKLLGKSCIRREDITYEKKHPTNSSCTDINLKNKIKLQKTKKNRWENSQNTSKSLEFCHESSSRQNLRSYKQLDRNKPHQKTDNEDCLSDMKELVNKQFRSSNFELIPGKMKRTINRPNSSRKNFRVESFQFDLNEADFGHQQSLELPSESESEDSTIETQSDFSDAIIKISDEDLEFEHNKLPTHSGPINKNLRDLYCSSYLQHKLDLLKVEETRLSQELTSRRYEAFYSNQFEDVDEGDIAGGVLI